MRLGQWLARSATWKQRDRKANTINESRLRPFRPMCERLEDRTTPAALSPCNFATIGTFAPVPLGNYTVDESGANPVIRDTLNNVIFTGVFSGGVAVFDFNNFTLAVGQTLTYVGVQPDPVAFLTEGSMTIAGTIDFSGQSALDVNAFASQAPDINIGGPGGGSSGSGAAGGFGNPNPFLDLGFGVLPYGFDNGGNGQGPGHGNGNRGTGDALDLDPFDGAQWFGRGAASGGGFGGRGARGASGREDLYDGDVGQTDPGAVAGGVYGNIFTTLQGGSGGGGTCLTGGGGGGGAVELGAVTQLTITATGVVDVHGGSGAVGAVLNPANPAQLIVIAGSGGGSGGGVLMHAVNINIAGVVNASGGDGGGGGFASAGPLAAGTDGGAGGGGRVGVIFATTFTGSGNINVNGGISGNADPGNPTLGIPANAAGPGIASPDLTGANGTLGVQTQAAPVKLVPSNLIRVYFPVRYTFDPRTGLYSGFVTIQDTSPTQDFTGPISIAFTTMPNQVTVANNTGITTFRPAGGLFCTDAVPGGLFFIANSGSILRSTPLRIFVQFRDPLHLNLSTFFNSNYQLLVYQGTLT